MKRYIINLLGLLFPFVAIAQTDGYDPVNPPNPAWPVADTTTYYKVNCVSIPDGAGSFSGYGDRFKGGQSVTVSASTHNECYFICWKDANGNVLTENKSYRFTMPYSNVTLYAVYEYNPSSPGNPVFSRDYPLTVECEPQVAGSFNIKSGVMVKEGTTQSLNAYCNNGFRFLRWETEDGDVLGTETRLSLLMPSHAYKIKGIYEYAPEVPVNPGTNSWDRISGQAIIDFFNPGYLTSAIRSMVSSTTQLTHLVVDGQITSNDFSFTNTFTSLTSIDLSRVAGVSAVPSYWLDGNTNVKEIDVPSCVSYLGNYSFRNCAVLKSFNCYATVPPSLGTNVFTGVPDDMTVYVPETSVELYQATEGWNSYNIAPLRSKLCALEINLPAECSDGRYKNMSLELVNVKSGQKYRYVITDRLNYTFGTLVKNTVYNAYLKNLSGQIIGEKDLITVDDRNVSVTMSDLKLPRTLSLKVIDADDNDVTSQASIVWSDEAGTYLQQGPVLASQIGGYKVSYDITLPKVLAMKYIQPTETEYTVKEGTNDIVVKLESIPQYKLTGKVVNNMTGLGIAGANVSISQTIAGKYSDALNVKTLSDGSYEVVIFSVPSEVTISANDCVNGTVSVGDDIFAANAGTRTIDLGTMSLKPISGVVMNLSFSYTESVAQGEVAETLPYYSDMGNVSYSLYNKTLGKEITSMSVQYPNIVVLEDVHAGDELELTCRSKSAMFKDVKVSGVVDSDNHLSVKIPIVELGAIKARFLITDNTAVEGILYDSKGVLVSHDTYKGNDLTFSDLADGTYTLVTMGQSPFFNSIFSLDNLADAGMTEDVDYLKNVVNVKSGEITALRNVVVPLFNESKYYYTGKNTSFSVNKANVIAGNYLTLSGKIDFLDAYKQNVSDIEMVIKLPESCGMVEKSVIVGNNLSSYEYRDNTVTIPMGENYTDRVKFCIVPSERGNYTPNAFVRFNLDGKTILQPIGSAAYTVTDITIWSAPLISLPTISIDGNAPGQSQVVVYDGQTVIGTTKALADGYWSLQTELKNCMNLSIHEIWAEVTAPSGFKDQTETRFVEYNERSIQAKTVEMSFYNGLPGVNRTIWVGFDLEHIKASSPSYMFASGTDFVFTADLTNNDPEVVNSCIIRVFTNNHEWIELPARFIPNMERWVAVGKFDTRTMPIGVRVVVDADISTEIDYSEFVQINTVPDAVEQTEGYVTYVDNMPNEDNGFIPEVIPDLDETFIYDNTTQIVEEIQQTAQQEPVVIVDEVVAIDNDNISGFNGWNNNGQYAYYEDDTYSVVINEDEIEDVIELPATQEDTEDVKVTVMRDGTFIINDPNTNMVWGIDLVQEPSEYYDEDEYYDEYLDNNYPTHPDRSSMRAAPGHTGRIAETLVDTLKNEIMMLEKAAHYVNSYIKSTGDPIRTQLGSIDLSLKDAEELTANLVAYKAVHPEESASVDVQLATLAVNVAQLKKTRYELNTALAEVNSYISIVRDLNRLISYGHYAITDVNDWQVFIDRILPCNGLDDPQARALYWISDSLKFKYGHRYITVCQIASMAASVVTSVAHTPQGVPMLNMVKGAVAQYLSKTADLVYRETKATSRNRIRKAKRDKNRYINCNYAELEEIEDKWDFSLPYPVVEPIIDPSGFVYEGVSSNRLEGVTATAYYKHTYEDMYGDMQQEIVLWDAAMYGQENPLYTDEQGMYQWDVPQGEWQVKFEKEGYQTAYSEWLPVPPPQMDVNIGLVQNVQPEVVSARAFEVDRNGNSSIEVTFSKYMNPESLNAGNIFVKGIKNGTQTLLTNLSFSYPDLENVIEGNEQSYARTVSVDAGNVSGYDEMLLIVNTDVESYAGIKMTETYEQKLDIEKKLVSIAADSIIYVGYGEKTVVLVGALPIEAAAGKKITVRSESSMIAALNGTSQSLELTLDAYGQAQFELNGSLFGSTAVKYQVQGEDLAATTLVSVVDASLLEEVKAPVASRISGTSVFTGQTVSLSCETGSAVIYYTLDGSCPCESDKRILYSGPITITDSTTIKAMAIGISGSESTISEFRYSVRTSSVAMELEEGWNWASHDLSAPLTVAELQSASTALRTKDGETVKVQDSDEWNGSVPDVQAVNMIKVKADASARVTFQGDQFNAQGVTVTLKRGWNWLGYPLDQAMLIDDALSYLNVDEGDVITGLEEGFAEYSNGRWTGNLKVFTPGHGYMYKSMSEKSFIYGTVVTVSPATVSNSHLRLRNSPWSVNPHAYPDMMAVTATVMDGDSEAPDSIFQIGVFCGNECRGIGSYIDGTFKFSVYGENAENLVFKAINVDTNEEYSITESVVFTPDVLGSQAAPYVLNFETPSGVQIISPADNAEFPMFNIKGQMVQDEQAESGIYIIDGTKILK